MSLGPETKRAPPMHDVHDDLADTLDDHKDALRARAASLEVTAGPDAGSRGVPT